MDDADRHDLVAVVARLFPHLAPRGLEWREVFAIDHAPGHFQRESVDSVAVLIDHDDAPIGGERDDTYPIRNFENVEVVLLAGARRAPPLLGHREHAAVVDGLRLERVPGS